MIDLTTAPEAERVELMESKATEIQQSFDLATGPLVRIVLFDLGQPFGQRLLIVAHHLVIDGISWRILLEDLATAYSQACSQEPKAALPAKTSSFQSWARKLAAYAQEPVARQQLEYWLRPTHQAMRPLPIDFVGQDNTFLSAATVEVSLNAQETEALLKDVPPVYHTQINDVLLAALALTISANCGTEQVLIDLEGHGREELFADIDLSRTVGWFTCIYPALLIIADRQDLGATLRSIKEQLRALPQHGIGYGILRYLSQENTIEQRLRRDLQSQILFNYLGQLDQSFTPYALFIPASESGGTEHSTLGLRRYLWEINALIINGQLHISWQYSMQLHHRSTIEQIAQLFIDRLRALIAHCQSPDAGGFTVSDFPLAELDEEDMDQLASLLEGVDSAF